MLGMPRALVIRGVEGDPELSIAMATKVLELRDDRIAPLTFAPKDAGLPLATSREMTGFPNEHREKEADLLRRILQNRISGGPRDWVLLNAGLLLYAAGKGASIGDGVSLARRTLEDGTAARKLESLSHTTMAAVQQEVHR
jgi:anthranilate phosphoribosyltransferase